MKSPALALVAAGALLLTGCAAPAAGDDESVSVVASTDVWGDIAAQIGGDDVTVTSIIDSPDKDPHEYEASARDQLAVSRADILVVNGGGYDDFMTTLLKASDSDPEVIDAVELSGLAEEDDAHDDAHEGGDEEGHEHGEFNEHVWYDLGTAIAVAQKIADDLSDADPTNADGYAARLEKFESGVQGLQASVDAMKSNDSGRDVAVTEPVPLWLLQGMGLVNVTPPEFSEAVEEDSDVPAGVLQDLLDTVGGGSLALLAYNDQSATGQTELVRTAAEKAGVPVVDFTETLPEGETYLTWMKDNIDRTAQALGE